VMVFGDLSAVDPCDKRHDEHDEAYSLT